MVPELIILGYFPVGYFLSRVIDEVLVINLGYFPVGYFPSRVMNELL